MTPPASDRELILLGTGTSHGVPMIGCECHVCRSSDPRNHRTRTGVVIRLATGNLLIDTSPELRIQLLRERIPVIHAVLYTHSHADHLFGLDDLRLFGHYLNRPVPLYCEAAVEDQIRRAFHYAFVPPYPNDHPGAVPLLEFQRLTGERTEILGQEVVPIRLWHGKLPVLGYRFDNVAFCTDVSLIPDESWPLLEDLDVLIIDGLRDKPHPTHFSVDQALEVIARVKPRRAYLTHVSHQLEYTETNARLPAGVELAYDGLRIPF